MQHRKKGRYTMTTSDREAIIAECESNAVPWNEIDFSQIPEITDFSGFYPGRQGVSEKNATQECVSVQFNKVLLDHLRSKGMGWQVELNNFLMSAYKKGLI